VSGSAESLLIQNSALFGGKPVFWNPDQSYALKGLKNFLFNYREYRLSPEEVEDFDLDAN